MAPSALDRAVSDRDRMDNDIGILEAKLLGHKTVPINLVRAKYYLAKSSPKEQDLLDNYEKLYTLADKADHRQHLDEYNALIDRVSELNIGFEEIIAAYYGTTGASSGSAPSTVGNIRLPRFELPTFSGDLQEWISFRDMFIAAVHSQASISGAQKLTYLKRSLSGEAARLVNTLTLTDDNYDIAWSQLEHRYQNERELVYSILKKFFAQPNIQSNSSTAIKSLIDVTKECIRSLEVLHRPVDQWDDILLYQMFQRVDQSSRELWEQSLKDTSIPPLSEFMEFLESRARALAAGGSSINSKQIKQDVSGGKKQTYAHHVDSSGTPCKVCSKGSHLLYQCPSFRNMTNSERHAVVKRGSYCFNCLSHGHSSSKCSSQGTCKTCKAKHHSMIHLDNGSERREQAGPAVLPVDSQGTSKVTNFHTSDDRSIKQNLLATAVISIEDIHGQQQSVRALLDGGSTSSFISDACVLKLGLTRRRGSTEVLGLASTSLGATKGMVFVNISPHFNNTKIPMQMLILPKVTGLLPTYPCDPTVWPHLQGLELADPYYHQPSKIDILLGADIFWNILLDGKKTGTMGSPVGVRSELGWLIAGQLDAASNRIVSHYADVDLDKILQQFWEIESVPTVRSMSKDEQFCESHFQSTHTRDKSGRFTVKLPYRNPPVMLGSSRELAIRRLKQIEKRLDKLPERKEQYQKFMNDYLTMGHMEQIPEFEINHSLQSTNYIPHHFVLKDENNTTKFRVVFDASMETSSKVSFNQALMVGPTIQDSIIDILTRFRKHSVAFTADIQKMYRQIRVTKDDADMQRILWRNSPSEPIKDYRLLTVTYGTAPAPYLATKVLQQMANEAKSSCPLGAEAIENDMYVDDVMSGANSVLAALDTQKQILQIMDAAKMPLVKWSSNSQEMLETLPTEMKATNTISLIDRDHSVKALGVSWNTTKDKFQFRLTIDMTVPATGFTKRILLSEIAKIWDPQGWLAPTIIRAKILLQSLWKLEIGWDIRLPSEIEILWLEFRANLHSLEQIEIPRCILHTGVSQTNLIGFCDASEKAYAAVVYTCCYDDNGVPLISLISAKTRVAPAKQVSLPRLELCGAVLLINLMKTIKAALKMTFHEIVAFTDSTVVLAWIQAHPSKWKTFVANRVTEIQDSFPVDMWRHVKGTENPADCASRGLDPSEVKDHPLWLQGPPWLKTWTEIPPLVTNTTDSELQLANLESKAEPVKVHHICTDQSLIHKFSSLSKLTRHTAYLRRFSHNCLVRVQAKQNRLPLNQEFKGPLSPTELKDALISWIRIVQDEAFSVEIRCLQRYEQLPNKSRIISLNPFLDSSGLLRVGGRLRNANIPSTQKTPILLPKQSEFTRLLIDGEHHKYLHAGATLLLSIITRQYWIVGAKDAIRHQIKKCTICTRHSAKTLQQLMGDLPSVRVTPARPFLKCGVDYAGPFSLKPIQARSKTTIKGYLAIFVCFTTRAVHLEAVSSLSTEAFLAAFRRFIARRGKPSDIYSDCGTNFIGAAAEIKNMIKMVKSYPHNLLMANEMSKDGVTWHFNSPGAPHMGGLWEAGVKSVKFHLYRVVGSARLTFEELTTILTQVEACLNSRPLTPVSSDPNDFEALTPGHFLIGAPLTALADPDLLDVKVGRLSRWQLLQRLLQQFWKRWSSEVVARMQQRPKWMKSQNNIKLNSLVLIKDENLPPLKWRLGRVIHIHPGPDGLTRVITLKTATGEMKRPIVKVCLLPVDPVDDAT